MSAEQLAKTPLGSALSDRKTGKMARGVDEAAVGGVFLGDDGRPSLCQTFVKRDKWSRGRMWGRCIG